jgi:hypothetical protein
MFHFLFSKANDMHMYIIKKTRMFICIFNFHVFIIIDMFDV